MTTIRLASRAAPSLYQGMILALLACAFALQASFLVALARGGGALAGRPLVAAVTAPASSSPSPSPWPCPVP